ncbi:MAG: SH3 domain-containing protein [Hyphomonas sp.]|nr:SH3 domain-containing protein [Hyphomonas sp.]
MSVSKLNKSRSWKGAVLASAGLLSLASCTTIADQANKYGISDDALTNTVGVLTGVATTLVCNDKTNATPAGGGVSKQQLACAGIGLLAGVATAYISKKILKGLRENDQQAVVKAASKSLETGETVTVELPDSGKTLTVAPAGNSEQKVVTESVLADLEKVPSLTGPYAVVGKVYSASGDINVRSGAGTQFDVADTLASGSKVHVFGAPEGSDWYLVGKAIEAEGDWGPVQVPVAIGYVRADLLQEYKSASPLETAEYEWLPNKAQPEKMTPIEASWTISCEKYDMTLKSADSEEGVVQDSSTLCLGPLGMQSA